MSTRPIRPGDLFVDVKGREWKVIECRPGGHVSLFCKAKSLFHDTYKKQIRAGSFLSPLPPAVEARES